jgi:hypothetical protein
VRKDLNRIRLALLWSGITLALIVIDAVPAPAQEAPAEEKKLGWKDRAELALVITGGNSSTSTFGFRNLLSRIWTDAELHIEAAGLRTETATVTATPVGTSIDDYVIDRESVSAVTAENYLARAKYDRQIRPRLFVFASGGWDRNEFAGIESRYYGAGGVGNIWYDREDFRWRTDYGVSITQQDETVGDSQTFAGLRFSSDFMRKLSASTTATNLTIADENLDDTSDLRIDSLTGLEVAMSSHLAIKVSLRLLFDNVPSFLEAELLTPGSGLPTGILVPVQAEELDTIFNVALVVNF